MDIQDKTLSIYGQLDFDENDEDMLVSQLNVDIANQYVVFSVGEEEYGIPILMVQEIISLPEMTRIPGVAEYIPGIINLRGNVIPLYSLRNRFKLDTVELNDFSIVIIVQLGEGEKRTVGLIVDAVSDVISIAADEISDTPPLNSAENIRFIDKIGRIGDRMIIIMNLESFFSEKEISVLDMMKRERADEAGDEGAGNGDE